MNVKVSSPTYFKDGWSNISIVKALIYSLAVMCILTLLVHATIIASTAEVLRDYKSRNFSTIEEIFFQVRKSLELTQLEEHELCSDADLNYLRGIKRTYYFLGDLGRTQDGKIICTIVNGVLASPELLPPVHTVSSDGFEYRNNQLALFTNDENKPTITYKNAVLSISTAYLIVSKHRYVGTSGMSGVMYFNGDDRYVFSYFGGILPYELDGLIAHKNSLLDWLPLPNRVRSQTQCNDEHQICMTAIHREMGLYGESDKHVSVILAVVFVLSLIVGILIEYYHVGSRAFVRKLKKQIDLNNIFPVYQPQFNIDMQEIVGVESLARWDDPRLGMISPEIFINVAEKFNLIETLTQKLVIKIFNELQQVLEANPAFSVSINISSELLTSNTFVKFLNDITSNYGFNREQVVLEVTERTVGNKEKMSEFSRQLKGHGYLVSIDDFGTGVSNLSWLSMLDPNEIKVDKIFTQSIDTQTVNNITLDGIFGMLERLKVRVVFEGIETQQQRDYISERVPNAIGQGWLYAKPQKIEDLIKYLNINEVKVLNVE